MLRKLSEDDAPELVRVVRESLPHLRPWLEWATDSYDHATAEAFLVAAVEGWARGTLFDQAITSDGAIVGVVSAGREDDLVEIGYWLHPAHTGRGLVTRAVAEVVELAFGLPGVRRVQIWHDEANVASGAVPRRLGFTEVDRRTPPRDPRFGAEIGVDVVWELRRDQ
ncbi:GNAT family N-acetyltransferase [Lentzea guizhouensis]|nr:GNAT family protein [Lentzea guizhouensis]